jgi:hypothetical protein
LRKPLVLANATCNSPDEAGERSRLGDNSEQVGVHAVPERLRLKGDGFREAVTFRIAYCSREREPRR